MDNFIAHILVVDDDDGIRSLVQRYLNEKNFLVNTANSAEDATKKIKIIKYDLIILDIMMPGKSGLDFIKENKKLSSFFKEKSQSYQYESYCEYNSEELRIIHPMVILNTKSMKFG